MVFKSSRGASTSSNKQNGAGFNSKKAKTKDIAVKAFSPPESWATLAFFLPGGLATIPTPEVNKSSPRSISSA